MIGKHSLNHKNNNGLYIGREQSPTEHWSDSMLIIRTHNS